MYCKVAQETIGWGMPALRLENELLSVTVIPEKGADIYRLVYRPAGIDVLWKSPWGLRRPGAGFATAPNSAVAWLEHYEGGWQELFPNGGDACIYQGVEMPFHGEASTLPWQAEILGDGGDEVRLRCSVRLCRSPFRLERTMIVRAGVPALFIEERATNEGGEPLAAMWSHHPAFGAPFLSGICRIDSDARSVWADPAYDTPGGRLQPGGRWNWPHAATRDGRPIDLTRVPPSGDALAYLGDFAEGWYAISNPDLGFGVALAWPAAIFPYAWLWQELHSSPGFPWYAGVYTMAIEPASSVPGQGLTAVMEQTASHLVLAPGASRAFHLTAAFYPIAPGHAVGHVSPTGAVTLRPV